MRWSSIAAVLALLLGGAAQAQDGSAVIPQQAVNPRIRAMLPKEMLDQGYLTGVNTGAYPPFTIVKSSSEVEGAGMDLTRALGQLFGVEMRLQTVKGLPAALAGVASKRYDFAFGPNADLPQRQDKADFVDWVRAYVSFLVPQGNPKGIRSIEDVCGLRVAVEGGGSAEDVLRKRSARCAAEGRPAVDIQSYSDQPAAVLAVRSNRSDAFFSSQSVLIYFAGQSRAQMEIAGANLPNGFPDIYQGAIVPKDSKLGDAFLAGFEELYRNGTYRAIMRKWGVDGMMLESPGKNLAK